MRRSRLLLLSLALLSLVTACDTLRHAQDGQPQQPYEKPDTGGGY
jgi:hypothetical protein